ncbi:hypothetical protein BDB01DRAFT_839325 [Pilobolus umbonatus]|nr:hypothetical protein BDB01DRAFT_839325 [Pilobolus umbonatus]
MCLKTKILILFACKEEDVDVDRDVDVDKDIDGCFIVHDLDSMIGLVCLSQLMYIHHKNYVFQKRWSKNRYPTHMNMHDTPPRIGLISLFYNIHMDPIYERPSTWIPILFYAIPFHVNLVCSWKQVLVFIQLYSQLLKVSISTLSYRISYSYNLYHWRKMIEQDADTEIGLHRIVIITGSSNSVQYSPRFHTLSPSNIALSIGLPVTLPKQPSNIPSIG